MPHPMIRPLLLSVTLLLQTQQLSTTMETVTLPYIIPDIRLATGYKAGVRPYREGGVRMDKTSEGNGKTVYHDYGHGGAGVSIAYGCARNVVEQLFLPDKVGKKEEIAVLGSGIVGLTTAYLLIQQGYKVNLYAELTPFELVKGKPEITTSVAAGYWMPLKVGNKAETAAQATDTWNHYEDIRLLQGKIGRNLGISLLPAYAINDDAQNFHFEIPGVIQPKDCMVTFGDRVFYKAKKFSTYVIETGIYLNYLREEMERTGRYKFINAVLKTKDDVLGMKETHIFNCLGFGSREVFGDKKMKAIKGHVIKFKLSDHQKVKDFLLVIGMQGGGLHLQVPQHQGGQFMMGVTFEQGKEDTNVDSKSVHFLIDRARNFFLQVQANKITAKL